jgi:stress response protein YsnF
VAAFDTKDHAMAAVNALKAGGYHSDDISIVDSSRLAGTKGVAPNAAKSIGLWQWLFGDIAKYEANVYAQTVNEGGTVVSVRVPRDQVAQAAGILDLHKPININDRAITAGFAPVAHVETAAKSIAAATPLAAQQSVAVTPKLAEVHGDTLRLAEEQLQIGKKMVETGRTRVRRFTTESDVAQDVTLHEEHAEVLRNVLSQQPAQLAEVDWADGTLEFVETKEQALVNKVARLVEEVSLRRKGDDHVETIHEKLRRQQAEVEQVDATGKPIRRA